MNNSKDQKFVIAVIGVVVACGGVVGGIRAYTYGQRANIIMSDALTFATAGLVGSAFSIGICCGAMYLKNANVVQLTEGCQKG